MWKDIDHEQLFNFTKDLNGLGVLFMMTNSDADYVHEQFKQYNIERVPVRRFIDALKYRDGQVKKERSIVNDVVIRNY